MLVMTMFYIKLAWDWLENGGGAGGASYLFLTNSHTVIWRITV